MGWNDAEWIELVQDMLDCCEYGSKILGFIKGRPDDRYLSFSKMTLFHNDLITLLQLNPYFQTAYAIRTAQLIRRVWTQFHYFVLSQIINILNVQWLQLQENESWVTRIELFAEGIHTTAPVRKLLVYWHNKCFVVVLRSIGDVTLTWLVQGALFHCS
jgi:hypothetical protein